MKFSEAMLKGFRKVNGHQFFGGYYADRPGGFPRSVCVLGAANLGAYGDPWSYPFHTGCGAVDRFANAWGLKPQDLNDEGMPWEHIYGMAVAAGL